MDLAIREAKSMPWREVSIMDQRREFVQLAMQGGVNRRELCRRFDLHPDTGYKWLSRWQIDQGLADRSRRPHTSPQRTGNELEERISRSSEPCGTARHSKRLLPSFILHSSKRKFSSCGLFAKVMWVVC